MERAPKPLLILAFFFVLLLGFRTYPTHGVREFPTMKEGEKVYNPSDVDLHGSFSSIGVGFQDKASVEKVSISEGSGNSPFFGKEHKSYGYGGGREKGHDGEGYGPYDKGPGIDKGPDGGYGYSGGPDIRKGSDGGYGYGGGPDIGKGPDGSYGYGGGPDIGKGPDGGYGYGGGPGIGKGPDGGYGYGGGPGIGKGPDGGYGYGHGGQGPIGAGIGPFGGVHGYGGYGPFFPYPGLGYGWFPFPGLGYGGFPFPRGIFGYPFGFSGGHPGGYLTSKGSKGKNESDKIPKVNGKEH